MDDLPKPESFLRRHGLALALVAVCLVPYLPSAAYPFVNWDDPEHVYRNPALQDGRPLAERLYPRHLGYPMPLTMLSYQLEHWLLGSKPLAWSDGALFHCTNLVLFFGILLAAYRLLLRIVSPQLAVLVLALFATHPLLVEPVCWVTGRKDLLATLFVLLATDAFVGLLRGGRWPSLVGALLAGLAALASKPSGALLLLLWPALYWIERRRERTAPLGLARPLAVWLTITAGSIAVIAIGYLGNKAVGGVASAPSVLDVLRRAWWALGFHCRLWLLPVDLRARYMVSPSGLDGYDVLAALVVAALCWVFWRRRTLSAPLSWAVALFVAAYAPVANLLPLTRYLADSYMLLPSLALALALALLLRRLLASVGPVRMISALFVVGLLALYLLIGTDQRRVWASSQALWLQTMRHHPTSPNACRMLGHAFNEQQLPLRAARVYLRCVRLFGSEDFANNLAISYLLAGQQDEARRWFLEVLRHRPNDRRALKYLRQLGPAGRIKPAAPASSERTPVAPAGDAGGQSARGAER
ncbi:MAG: hypothetical protein H6707_02820 [Deltaproteobacteria bacterium]|nr:hypothetical protein [Deltaproteobacteria bacterium]